MLNRTTKSWDKNKYSDYARVDFAPPSGGWGVLAGPLARVTLGEQQVQGLDYAYTLQGWLKGMNSTGGADSFDMGGDAHAGSLNQLTAKDAIGLTLNYFANDYTAINGTPFPGYSGHLPTGAYRPLYNGNISSSSVYQNKFDYDDSPGGPLIFYNYKYDQLNRLTGQDAFTGFNSAGNSWSAMATMGENLKERIAYDANGNILKYLRKSITGTTANMDSLHYHYYAGANQLKQITDNVPANGYVDPDNRIVDIDGQSDNNYGYDAIGNLIKDDAEKITGIKWNVYGKIQEITKNVSGAITTIKYTYDASGNRISQTVISPTDDPVVTWYVRDAQGNIMSTYNAKGDNSDLEDLTLKQSEKFLYGSSRLGLMTIGESVDGGPDPMQNYYGVKGYDRGDREYELTNHLGNVLATISDRKFGVTSGSSSLISYYEPHIVTAQDYYPFGMMSRVDLPGSGKSYKFGFNGKMNDNEVKGGLGNQQDYGMRIYDARVGRFLSVDPLTKQYPMLTPYQFASNRPIDGTDLDGLEWQSSGKYFNSVTGKYTINYTVTLSLNNMKNVLDLVNNKALLNSIEKKAEANLSKLDAKGTETDPIINVDIIFTKEKGNFNVAFFNAETIAKFDAKSGKTEIIRNETFAGKVDEIGQTQENTVLIPLSNTFTFIQPDGSALRSTTSPGSDEALARSFSHELGHTAGLRHPFDPKAGPLDVKNVQGLLPIGDVMLILQNLMNSPGNQVPGLNTEKQNMKQGTQLTKEQREKIEATVQEQQPTL